LLFFAGLAIAQKQDPGASGAKSQEADAGQDLKMITIGEGRLASGEKTGFRIYETPDGRRATVLYTTFASQQNADRQIEEWLKAARKIVTREKDTKTKDGHLIDERIVALAEIQDSGKAEQGFVIIRRDGLDGYLIGSVSLEVATQVEGLIGHK
jgi:hypothetical protein